MCNGYGLGLKTGLGWNRSTFELATSAWQADPNSGPWNFAKCLLTWPIIMQPAWQLLWQTARLGCTITRLALGSGLAGLARLARPAGFPGFLVLPCLAHLPLLPDLPVLS